MSSNRPINDERLKYKDLVLKKILEGRARYAEEDFPLPTAGECSADIHFAAGARLALDRLILEIEEMD